MRQRDRQQTHIEGNLPTLEHRLKTDTLREPLRDIKSMIPVTVELLLMSIIIGTKRWQFCAPEGCLLKNDILRTLLYDKKHKYKIVTNESSLISMIIETEHKVKNRKKIG